MAKNIIKEIGIGLLLLISIALLLGILLYDYFPNNKTVPIEIQAYNMPDDIKLELEEAMPEEQNIVRTYYIDSTDLNAYESTNDYDKGKANPFAENSSNTQNTSDDSTVNKNNITNNKENTEQNNKKPDETYITAPGKN